SPWAREFSGVPSPPPRGGRAGVVDQKGWDVITAVNLITNTIHVGMIIRLDVVIVESWVIRINFAHMIDIEITLIMLEMKVKPPSMIIPTVKMTI
ncbi:MAG: hypothetical protein AAGK97_14690, partial [Bacteroidota bacterium]